MDKKTIKYSQNFLRSRKLVKTILDKSNIKKNDLVLEIGPGKGIITEEIARRCRQIIAIEKDKRFYELLRKKFAYREKISIVLRDFLDYYLPAGPYKIFSNIPFNLTAEIIKKITSGKNCPEDAYLIIQKEAAKKFIGFPYSQKTQMYALLLKPWFNIEVIHTFKKTDFKPVPQVNIILVHISKRQKALIESDNKKLYQDFIAYGFNQWKPTIKKALEKIFTYKQLKRLSNDLGFNLFAKPTGLRFNQWLNLFNYFLIGVSKNKQSLVYGCLGRLKKQQQKLHKIHRTRL